MENRLIFITGWPFWLKEINTLSQDKMANISQASIWNLTSSWWRLQMETFSALLAICAGNSPVPGEFPAQRPVTWSFDVFFDLRLNKQLSKQSWGWWFEMLSCPLWCHHSVDNGHLPGSWCSAQDCHSLRHELIWTRSMFLILISLSLECPVGFNLNEYKNGIKPTFHFIIQLTICQHWFG